MSVQDIGFQNRLQYTGFTLSLESAWSFGPYSERMGNLLNRTRRHWPRGRRAHFLFSRSASLIVSRPIFLVQERVNLARTHAFRLMISLADYFAVNIAVRLFRIVATLFHSLRIYSSNITLTSWLNSVVCGRCAALLTLCLGSIGSGDQQSYEIF